MSEQPPGSGPEAPVDGLGPDVAAMMDRHWRPEGFTSPNLSTYPWQWLWDSCFHALIWAQLDRSDRALVELTSLFAHQGDDGFVPHMTYWGDAGFHAGFWGRRQTSTITQPPMYGHALAVLIGRGCEVPADLSSRARLGLRHLLDRPRHSGLVRVVHPWETGCDDSPRWDDLCPGGFDAVRWRAHKGDLVAGLSFGPQGSPLATAAFDVAPAGFSALVAFNARELGTALADDELFRRGNELARAVDRRWSRELRTWVDAGAGDQGSGRCRTLDGLLPVLCTSDASALDLAVSELLEPAALGAPFGPRGVHLEEEAFDPTRYWRGPSWPQLTYLLALAADRAGRAGVARRLSRSLRAGARRSGLAEYWHPDTAEGLGAIPQSWAGLSIVAGR